MSSGKVAMMTCVLCDHCTAVCCHYVAVPLDEPAKQRDFDDMRWYLMHEGVTVFIEEGEWYIQFRTRCRNLRADFKCGVYETRPQICREYKADGCDYAGGEYTYERVFTEPDQIVEYGREILAKRRAVQRRRKARQGKSVVRRKQRSRVAS